jgi:hypothetical protein
MFLIRMAFWVGVVVLLMPTDERQQARVYGTAVAAVERVTTFCDRNPQACAAGAELWATIVKKAEFGVRMAIDLATSSGRKEEESAPARTQPASVKARPETKVEPKPEARQEMRVPAAVRGTLTPADLAPAWRGTDARPMQRAGL